MMLYLRMFKASIQGVSPTMTSDAEVVAVVLCFALGALSAVFTVAMVLLGGPWLPFLVAALGQVFIGLHIETMARIREVDHICTDECR